MPRMPSRRFPLALALLALAASPALAQKQKKKPKPGAEAAASLPRTPLGLTDWTTTAPKDNAVTIEKWTLGQLLFWDSRLSPAGTHSCESCHHPDQGWTDGLPLSRKPDGKENTRHSPTLYNVAYNTSYYWDGRAPTLEKQVAAAWDGQLGAKDKHAEVLRKLGDMPGYKDAFKKAFGTDVPTDDMVVGALATFLRSILSGDSKWDQFDAGNQKALSASAQKGWDLFRSRAKCGSCHAGFALSDWQFHNIGIGMADPAPDPGRGKIASDARLNGAFKTPTLRSVSRHPPYSHLGNIRTLDEMVAYFEHPFAHPNLDPSLKDGDKVGIVLSSEDKKALVDFLRSLDGKDDPMVSRKPKLP